jgi:hypothetical protein
VNVDKEVRLAIAVEIANPDDSRSHRDLDARSIRMECGNPLRTPVHDPHEPQFVVLGIAGCYEPERSSLETDILGCRRI